MIKIFKKKIKKLLKIKKKSQKQETTEQNQEAFPKEISEFFIFGYE